MRAKRRIFIGAAMALMLLMITPRAVQSEDLRTINLTRLFGIRSVYAVLVLDTDSVCIIDIESADKDSKVTVTFADVARERILGQAQFVRSGYLGSFKAHDGNVRFTFEQYVEEIDDILLEEVVVAPNGEVTSRSLPPSEQGTFPLPGGGSVVEQDANLYLRGSGEDTLQTLLAGVPFDSDIENIFDTLCYRFFQALDDSRFVYGRMGWEWSSSYGVYDLQSGKDLLLDISGAPHMIYDGKLYATTAIIDLNTYEQKALPKVIQDIMNGIDAEWALSPDGRMLCALVQPYDGSASLAFYDLISGKRLETIPLEAGYWELLGYVEEGVVALNGYDRERGEELIVVCSVDFER